MGGSATVNPANYITPPNPSTNIALVNAESGLQSGQVQQGGALLDRAAGIAPTPYSPNIWGAQGAENQAKAAATQNIANSQAVEKQFSPDAAALRAALPKDLNADLNGDYFKTMTPQVMSQLFGSGLSPDSVIGKSALFDQTTAQGLAERRSAEQAASGYLAQNQAPVAGVDPGAVVSQEQKAAEGNNANQNAFVQNVIQGANQNNQSTTDWINQLMGNVSNANQTNNQDWQNYEQAFMNSAGQNASGQNSMTGAEIGAGGAALGVAAIAI